MPANNQYMARINEAIDYINRNLDQDLSLQELSRIASFSPFHFHKLFKAVIGETPGDYVARIRVENGAMKLIHNRHLSITEIALDCGFSSNATFTRAFKKMYGVSPSAYRQQNQNRKIGKADRKNSQFFRGEMGYDHFRVATQIRNREEFESMKVEVKQLPDFHVAYVRHLEGYDEGVYNEGISRAFDKAAQWVGARDLFRKDTVCMGIFYEHGDVTAAEKRRYDAAFTIPPEVKEGSGEVGVQDITGGTYAIVHIEVKNEEEGSFARAISEMGKAFDYLYGEWLPDSPYQLADKPCLELYLTPQDAPVIKIDACLPVIPL